MISNTFVKNLAIEISRTLKLHENLNGINIYIYPNYFDLEGKEVAIRRDWNTNVESLAPNILSNTWIRRDKEIIYRHKNVVLNEQFKILILIDNS